MRSQRSRPGPRPSGVGGDDRYRAALGTDPAEIAEVRAVVRDLAVGNGFAERAGDLVLALDEAIANAQEHTGGRSSR